MEPGRRPTQLGWGASKACFATMVGLSVAFTLSAVQYSFRYGRLTLPPAFDDVTYFADAAKRLQQLYDDGASVFFRGLLHAPPHSPYSTLEAFVSFLIFGLRDWAPYAGNSLLVLGFLALTNRLMEGLRAWHKACAFLILLSFPLLMYAVITCRPDFAAGLLVAAGTFTLLDGRTAPPSLRDRIVGGTLFGTALLAKPSVFPATLAVLAACLLALAVRRLSRRRLRASFIVPETIRRSAAVAIPVAALAGPYFLLGGRETWHYIWINTFGANAEVWRVKMSLFDAMQFYITGRGGEMLGWHAGPLTITFVSAIAFYLMRRRRDEWVDLACLAGVLLVSYAICTANQMKHKYLGLTFQVTFIFSAIVVLRNMVLSQRLRRQLPWAEALLLLVTGLSILAFRWPLTPAEATIGVRAIRRDTAEQILLAVHDRADAAHQSAANAPRPTILVTFSGGLSAPLLNYLALQKLYRIEFFDLDLGWRPGQPLEALDGADFVICCDPEMSRDPAPGDRTLIATFIPGNGFQSQILGALKARSDYALAETIEYPTNRKNFYVFARRRATKNE